MSGEHKEHKAPPGATTQLVVFISGPQRGGKSYLCGEFAKQGVPVFDVDDYTVHRSRNRGPFRGTRSDIMEAVAQMGRTILEDDRKHPLLVFCGVSVVYCDEKDVCPRDLAGEVIRQIDSEIRFQKYYLEVPPMRLLENIIQARAKWSPSLANARRNVYQNKLGATEANTPEQVERKFVDYYDRMMSTQLLARGLAENKAVHQKFGYVPIALSTGQDRHTFLQRLMMDALPVETETDSSSDSSPSGPTRSDSPGNPDSPSPNSPGSVRDGRSPVSPGSPGSPGTPEPSSPSSPSSSGEEDSSSAPDVEHRRR